MKADYSNTYWSHKGRHEALITELNKLVPSSGGVENTDDNPALEKFRVASNCYYDLYNNGLGNRGKEFEGVFGFSAFDVGEDCNGFSVELTQELIDRTESKMDEIIVRAAHKQHIGETKTGTIDITPRGCETAEGCARVAKAQEEWDSVTHQLANTLKELLDGYAYGEGFTGDELHQLKALVGARDRKQEAFLRAVAGR
jgi:hypothetical protein